MALPAGLDDVKVAQGIAVGRNHHARAAPLPVGSKDGDRGAAGPLDDRHAARLGLADGRIDFKTCRGGGPRREADQRDQQRTNRKRSAIPPTSPSQRGMHARDPRWRFGLVWWRKFHRCKMWPGRIIGSP